MTNLFNEDEFSTMKALMKDKLPKLIDVYIRSSDMNMQKIAQATQDKDTKVIAYYAHAMKSASGNIGLAKLYELLNEIEVWLEGEIDYADVEFELESKLRELKGVYEKSRQLLLDAI